MKTSVSIIKSYYEHVLKTSIYPEVLRIGPQEYNNIRKEMQDFCVYRSDINLGHPKFFGMKVVIDEDRKGFLLT